jgi:hypothetical protein
MTTASPDSEEDTDEEVANEHLESIEDGCGCTEIWEHLSEKRDNDT